MTAAVAETPRTLPAAQERPAVGEPQPRSAPRPDDEPYVTEHRDEPHYEVRYGVRVETPWMGTRENKIALRLGARMELHSADRGLGDVIHENLFWVDRAADLQLRPDLAFVSRARWPGPVPDENVWDVVPDLAVEVVSRSNSAFELKDKLRDYFRCGVRAVWVVYPPHRQIECWTSPTQVRILTEAEALEGGDVLPEFSVAVSAVFADMA